MSPADSMPYRVPSSLATGMAEILLFCISPQARLMVTPVFNVGGVS